MTCFNKVEASTKFDGFLESLRQISKFLKPAFTPNFSSIVITEPELRQIFRKTSKFFRIFENKFSLGFFFKMAHKLKFIS
jgi:hypothetical protein